MTDEMLALAEENKRKSGLANVHFLKGDEVRVADVVLGEEDSDGILPVRRRRPAPWSGVTSRSSLSMTAAISS